MSTLQLQTMDITTLRAVLTELKGTILPSRFEQVQQPEPDTLQIALRTLKGLTWIELSWKADAPRLVQITPPKKAGTKSTLAKQFQNSLGKLNLIEIQQNGFERIVDFNFAKRPGDKTNRTLVLELMGRHSNCLLLNESRQIITLGRQVREAKSRVRPISTGDEYVDPPPLTGIKPRISEDIESWKNNLNLIPLTLKKSLQETYQGISPSLALQIANEEIIESESILEKNVKKISNEEWKLLYQRWISWLNSIERNSFAISFKGPTAYRVWSYENHNNTFKKESIALELGKYYREALTKRSLVNKAKILEKKLFNLLKTEEKGLQEQTLRLQETEIVNQLKQEADNLLSEFSPSKEIISKAQKLYKRSKKLRRSVSLIKERLRYHKERIEIITTTQSFLINTFENSWEDPIDQLHHIRDLINEIDELFTKFIRNNSQHVLRKKTQKISPMTIMSPAGLRIQIGRNHRQNEWISLQKSKPGDIWFHAQECPGSHVVLKSSEGLTDDSDLQLAADLAAYFSRAKYNSKVSVVMVATEKLRRVKGAAAGTLNYQDASILWAEPERATKHLPKPCA